MVRPAQLPFIVCGWI